MVFGVWYFVFSRHMLNDGCLDTKHKTLNTKHHHPIFDISPKVFISDGRSSTSMIRST